MKKTNEIEKQKVYISGIRALLTFLEINKSFLSADEKDRYRNIVDGCSILGFGELDGPKTNEDEKLTASYHDLYKLLSFFCKETLDLDIFEVMNNKENDNDSSVGQK